MVLMFFWGGNKIFIEKMNDSNAQSTKEETKLEKLQAIQYKARTKLQRKTKSWRKMNNPNEEMTQEEKSANSLGSDQRGRT